jgi:hypothetical protein
LVSIDERVRLVMGRMHIWSEIGRGTELWVRVPWRVRIEVPVEEEDEPTKSAAR